MYCNLKNKSSFIDGCLLRSKLSNILNSCEQSQKLIISICTVKEGRLVYYNKAFQKIIGCNDAVFFESDWKHGLSIVDFVEATTVEKKLKSFFTSNLNRNVFSLKYHITNFCGKRIYIKHEAVLFNLEKEALVLNYYYDISEKEAIEKCIQLNTACGFTNFKLISIREKEVLKLIADGFSSKQIADRLFISNHTAISHRKHLIEKFKVKNTAQLIKEASKVIEL
ncbi:response regulator transcription factor [Aquimarina agarilytica]|uniref:response regulator transcription factor n=1 Tax=Aquimarina agarilytica TaxID=1087449 RepID=UPI00028A1ACB|nr:helix-turn-helix transcriptional regulator [Aquimarina agarilytica]